MTRAQQQVAKPIAFPRPAATQAYQLQIATLPLPAEGFVRLPLVLRHYPVSRSAWWAGVKAGKYPPAIKLGPRATAWRVEDIRDLIERTARAA